MKENYDQKYSRNSKFMGKFEELNIFVPLGIEKKKSDL